MEPNPKLILPLGTQVVARVPAGGHPAGAVGEVVRAPSDGTHSYLVRFPDGAEVALRRAEIAIRKHAQRAGLDAGAALAEHDLYEHVIYRCVVGSRAYGLEHEGSDVDRRGVYLPPAELHWSLYGVPEQLESPGTEEVYWELQKFLTLALKANPNILECLFTPVVEHASPLAGELLAGREMFLSKLVYQTYNGYVMSQFKKLEQDLRIRDAIKWKHAMHLVRLLLSGVTILEEGYVPVAVGEHRGRLLDIRHGRAPWEEVDAWRLELHRRFDEAYRTTALPDQPDYARANDFLVRARRSMVSG